jgi:cobalt-zinc-cadmium resistance protein CzcA
MRCFIASLLVYLSGQLYAQQLTLDEAIRKAVKNNAGLQASAYTVQQQQALIRVAAELPKTDVNLMYGKYNSVNNDNNITITQTFPFPITLARQVQLAQKQHTLAESDYNYQRQQVVSDVKSVFYQLLFLRERLRLRMQADSLMAELAKAAAVRYRTGEGTLLELTTAETQHREAQMQLVQARAEYTAQLSRLSALVNSPVADVEGILHERSFPAADSLITENSPLWVREFRKLEVARATTITERSRLWPDLRIAYFNQTLIGVQNINGTDVYFGAGTRFSGFEAGLTLPLWLVPFQSRIKAAKLNERASAAALQQTKLQLQSRWIQLLQELNATAEILQYYREKGLPAADLMVEQSRKAFRAGEVHYMIALTSHQQAIRIKEEYANARNTWNQLIIELEFLMGKAYEE